MQYYSDDEITKAMQNYKRIISEPEFDLPVQFQYKTFYSFMGKGVEKFADGAKPFEYYKKRESQGSVKKQHLVTNLEA